ncbi:MAG: hypothetical protein S4CHLAM7_14970 [Chlamydiae bacterium]|nr:hypothetical protein [Chlamydiota bacterium]
MSIGSFSSGYSWNDYLGDSDSSSNPQSIERIDLDDVYQPSERSLTDNDVASLETKSTKFSAQSSFLPLPSLEPCSSTSIATYENVSHRNSFSEEVVSDESDKFGSPVAHLFRENLDIERTPERFSSIENTAKLSQRLFQPIGNENTLEPPKLKAEEGDSGLSDRFSSLADANLGDLQRFDSTPLQSRSSPITRFQRTYADTFLDNKDLSPPPLDPRELLTVKEDPSGERFVAQFESALLHPKIQKPGVIFNLLMNYSARKYAVEMKSISMDQNVINRMNERAYIFSHEISSCQGLENYEYPVVKAILEEAKKDTVSASRLRFNESPVNIYQDPSGKIFVAQLRKGLAHPRLQSSDTLSSLLMAYESRKTALDQDDIFMLPKYITEMNSIMTTYAQKEEDEQGLDLFTRTMHGETLFLLKTASQSR